MAIITADTPLGYELPPMYRQLSLELFGAGSGVKTIHNDDEAARREGLPCAVAVGPQVAGAIFKTMLLCFGEGWICGGKSDLTFRRPINSTDFITSRGVVTGKEIEGDKIRVHCEVWVEDARGQKAVVGKCSALV